MFQSVSFAIQVVGVEGDFDDCQRLVKSMFAEQEMKAFIGSMSIYDIFLFLATPFPGNNMGSLSTRLIP